MYRKRVTCSEICNRNATLLHSHVLVYRATQDLHLRTSWQLRGLALTGDTGKFSQLDIGKLALLWFSDSGTQTQIVVSDWA